MAEQGPDHRRHGHGHGHGEHRGLSALRHLITPHSHDSADRVDTALETSKRGIRALIRSFAALFVTAAAPPAPALPPRPPAPPGATTPHPPPPPPPPPPRTPLP